MSSGVGEPRVHVLLHTVVRDGRRRRRVAAYDCGRRRVLSNEPRSLRAVLSVHARAGAAGRRDGRDVAGAKYGDRVCDCAISRHGDSVREMGRRYGSGDRREVSFASLRRPPVVGHVVGRCAGGGRCARRGLGRAARNVDDEGFVDRLATGEVSVEGAGHELLGAQEAIFFLIAWIDANVEVGRVECPTERVGILAKDHVTYVVDQVLLVDGDGGGRSVGPLDPDLAGHHVDVDGLPMARVSGCVAAAGSARAVEQRADEARLAAREEALPSGGVRAVRGCRHGGACGRKQATNARGRCGGGGGGGDAYLVVVAIVAMARLRVAVVGGDGLGDRVFVDAAECGAPSQGVGRRRRRGRDGRQMAGARSGAVGGRRGLRGRRGRGWRRWSGRWSGRKMLGGFHLRFWLWRRLILSGCLLRVSVELL